MNLRKLRSILILASVGNVILISCPFAGDLDLSRGQTIYVPAYSYIRIGERGSQFDLATNLTVRNTDPSKKITVLSIDYYDSEGKQRKSYLDVPQDIKPLAAMNFFVKASDVTGGLAPSFIIKWKSADRVVSPIMEAVMIGDRSGQGISFVSVGKVIKAEPD